MYLRLVRAIDYLVTLPQWDGKRIAILGESQGGAQAAALAGIDNRITAASLRVPAFMDIAGKFDDRAGSWPQAYGRKAEEYMDVLPYYDAACLLTLTKARLFLKQGLLTTPVLRLVSLPAITTLLSQTRPSYSSLTGRTHWDLPWTRGSFRAGKMRFRLLGSNG